MGTGKQSHRAALTDFALDDLWLIRKLGSYRWRWSHLAILGVHNRLGGNHARLFALKPSARMATDMFRYRAAWRAKRISAMKQRQAET
jgi:hypothetical protein